MAEEKTAPPGEWAEAFRNESEQDMFSEAWAEKFKDDWVKSYEESAAHGELEGKLVMFWS